MKKLVALVCCLVLASFLQACGVKHTRGNQSLKGTSVSELDQKIQIGVSTKADVERWLGMPSGITKAKTGDTWRYKFGESESRVRPESFLPVVGGLLGGVDHRDESRILRITFDSRGRVESYGFESDDGSMRS